MTSTKIITAGVLAAAGSELSNATKVTLGATTKGYTLEAIVTNGAVPENTRQLKLEMRFVTTNKDGTAATIAAEVALNCNTKTGTLKTVGLEITHFYSKLFIPTGTILYVWFNSPVLPAAAAVDVWLNEID